MTTSTLVLFILFGIPVICATLVCLFFIFKGSSAIKGKTLSNEETRLLQEIHQGLEKMEKRIDALETIVIEQDKTREPTEV